MTDRLPAIKERLDLIDSAIPQQFVSECWGKYPPEHKSRKLPCADCARHELERGAFNKALTMLYENGQSDIAWLIAELEKERAKNNCPTCNFFRKDHDCGKQIETVTEFRCGTETVYKDGTKDFQWSPCGFCGRSQCDC